MVTPYMDHDLAGLLDNSDVHLTVPHIKCYMYQLLDGLAYLHEVCMSFYTAACSNYTSLTAHY